MPAAPLILLDPAAALIALAALLVAWAAGTLFRPLLSQLQGQLGVLGQLAVGFVDNILSGVQASVNAWLDLTVTPLIAVVITPWQKVDNLFVQAAAMGMALSGAIRALPDQIMQRVQSQTVAQLETELAQERAWAQTQIAELTSQIEWVHTHVDQDIHTWVGLATAELRTELAQAVDTAEAQASAGIASAQQGIAAAGAAAAALGAAETATAQRLASLVAQVGALSPAAVDGAIGQAAQGLLGQLDGVDNRLGGLIAGLGTALGAEQLARQAVAADLSSYLDSCGDPMCQGFLQQLRDMQGLQGLFDVAGILQLIAAAVHDPGGLAAALNDTLGRDVQAVVALIKEV